jgi:hypothetical protein
MSVQANYIKFPSIDDNEDEVTKTYNFHDLTQSISPEIQEKAKIESIPDYQARLFARLDRLTEVIVDAVNNGLFDEVQEDDGEIQ